MAFAGDHVAHRGAPATRFGAALAADLPLEFLDESSSVRVCSHRQFLPWRVAM